LQNNGERLGQSIRAALEQSKGLGWPFAGADDGRQIARNLFIGAVI